MAKTATIDIYIRWPLLCAVLCWLRLGWLAERLCIRVGGPW